MVNNLQGIHEGTRPSILKEAGNERCVYIMRVKADGTPVDLDIERGISLEEGEKLVIIVMNTDDMLIAYNKNACRRFRADLEREFRSDTT